MKRLDIRLFGGFEARLDTGEKLACATRKSEALLAQLAFAADKGRSRDQLAGLLWSDRGDKQARNSLRQALTSLRHGLEGNGTELITTEGENVRLDPQSISVDVVEFEQLAGNGSRSGLARADKLYQGALLDGFNVRDPAFVEWLTVERQRLHELAINAADQLLAGHLRDGDNQASIAAAQRLLWLDPLRESAYRTLMRLYAAQDQRGLAAREFERCRDILAKELDVEPAAATRRLYEAIIGSETDRESSAPAALLSGPLPLPSKPSVAVLPFANLSGDPEQSYLSDGITEDVITDLSRFRSLFVIGTETSMAVKDQSINNSRVAQDLGVEYVVEGSVRKAGHTLRVIVQLIDPLTGHRLWAERYDRPYEDVFDIQDEIVGNIAGALTVNIEHDRVESGRDRPAGSFDAYDYCLRARKGILAYTPEGFAEAKLLFHKAIELNAEYAPAWEGLARVYNKEAFFEPGRDPMGSLEKARAHGEKAIALDRKSAIAYAELAWVQLGLREFELARELLDQATELAPNDSMVTLLRAYEMAYLGDYEDALQAAEFGYRANPFCPDPYMDAKATAYFLMGHDRDALKSFAQVTDMIPDCIAWQAAACAYAGNMELARKKLGEFARAFGDVWVGDASAGVKEYAHWVTHIANPFSREEQRTRLVEGLKLAGLPI